MPDRVTLGEVVGRLRAQCSILETSDWLDGVRERAGEDAWIHLMALPFDRWRCLDLIRALDQEMILRQRAFGEGRRALFQQILGLAMDCGVEISDADLDLALNPPRCRFGCSGAVARFEMSKGCACYPGDRVQDLCVHHLGYSQPHGTMVLVKILVLDPGMEGWLRARFGFELQEPGMNPAGAAE